MIIKKVHCFFEQSGTFKNEFIKLGFPAKDYDIQNKFNQTDYITDLFNEIEQGYEKKRSIFDNITRDDLIIAFFPCTYFECMQMLYYCGLSHNIEGKAEKQKTDIIISRIKKRELYLIRLYQLISICKQKDIKLIIENPATAPAYLLFKQNFYKFTFIDNDRTKRGDTFRKPTAYWFFNCKPTNKRSYQPCLKTKTIKKTKKGNIPGICSTERSMITPEYAKNFIADFILGIETRYTIKSIFDNNEK